MGKYSIAKIYDVLKTTNFYTDKIPYLFAKLDKADYQKLLTKLSNYSDVYSEIINDKDELTILIPKTLWDEQFANEFKALEKMNDLALITCEVQKETVTGYLLAMATVLSPHNISIYVQGAFTTDHIFVDFTQLNEALRLLNQLKED